VQPAANISVREARAEDAIAAIEIVRDSITHLCVVDHHNSPHLLNAWLENKTPENFGIWLNNPENCVLVAEADSLCAVGLLHRSGEIRLLYVSPRMQRRGAGRALIDGIELQARTWGLTRLHLSSTANARPFYASAGYRDCNQAETWRGIVCYKYEKALIPIMKV
jgi:GNAT superfamily N-acetyltransferase